MTTCFLHGFGPCHGKLTGEHYTSRAVLELISPGGVTQIGGLPWQTPDEMKNVGIAALTANVLCDRHNSGLSGLDNEAKKLFKALVDVDKNRAQLPDDLEVDGPAVERWLLKVVCGLVAGPRLANGNVRDSWKSILTGSAWPEGWGLYVAPSAGPQVFATDFYFESKVNPETGDILCAYFRLAGVGFHLVLGRPDVPEAFGIYRPRGLIFKFPEREIRIEFKWPFATDQAVIFTNVGTSGEPPPQWQGWKEPPVKR